MNEKGYPKPTASVVIPYKNEEKNGFIYVFNLKDNKWGLPGGKLELFEEISIALSREVKEETGLEILLGKKSLLGYWYFKSEKGNSICNAVFYGEVIGGKLEITELDKIGAVEVLTIAEIRNLYREGKIRAGRANFEPIEEYLKGTKHSFDLIHTLF